MKYDDLTDARPRCLSVLIPFVCSAFNEILHCVAQVDLPFSGSGGETKNRFSSWLSWRPSWIFDRNDFSYFLSTSPSNASYPNFESIALSVQEKKRTMAAIFDFQSERF